MLNVVCAFVHNWVAWFGVPANMTLDWETKCLHSWASFRQPPDGSLRFPSRQQIDPSLTTTTEVMWTSLELTSHSNWCSWRKAHQSPHTRCPSDRANLFLFTKMHRSPRYRHLITDLMKYSNGMRNFSLWFIEFVNHLLHAWSSTHQAEASPVASKTTENEPRYSIHEKEGHSWTCSSEVIRRHVWICRKSEFRKTSLGIASFYFDLRH